MIVVNLTTRKIGPIYYIQLPNKKFVFLNSARAAFDLLESRSAIYSDRPRPQMPDLAGRTVSVFLTPFSHPRFKILRRLLQDGLSARAVKTYRPIQVQENRVFLRLLADSPDDFRAHIRRSVFFFFELFFGFFKKSLQVCQRHCRQSYLWISSYGQR
jgi:cytochrome P450